MVCNLASAFLEEMEEAGDGPTRVRSANLITHMRRLKQTRKESNASRLEREGLQADCKITWAQVGLKGTHPTLRVVDMLQTLAKAGKFSLLTGGLEWGFSAWQRFWDGFAQEEPSHPVFTAHSGRLDRVLPVYYYGDEGWSHKKAGFLVVSWQPVVGQGTSFSLERADRDVGTNTVGVSYTTRFLYTCMQRKLYSQKPAVFQNIMDLLSSEVRSLFEDGVQLTINGVKETVYCCAIGCKADWPMLHKMGNLNRAHHGVKAKVENCKGVCHLCMAGTPEHAEWHDIYSGTWKYTDTEDMRPPWSRESPLTRNTPFPDSAISRAWFYRPDVFHSFHKGLMAELAGSALGPLPKAHVLGL